MKTIIWNKSHTIALEFDLYLKDVSKYRLIVKSGLKINLSTLDEEIKTLQQRMNALVQFL